MSEIKVVSVFGTRPEAIKMAPVIKRLKQEPNINSKVIVTGQHRELLNQVVKLFNIQPNYNLQIMKHGQTLTDITSKILTYLSPVLQDEQPDLILVHGDTTTTFSSALTAVYNKFKIAHIEAGLRSGQRYFPYPEEFNRRLTGVLADLHFAPTSENKTNLVEEGIAPEDILVTGNTVIDSLEMVVKTNYFFSTPELQTVNFEKQQVILVTAHRRENWGQPIQNLCRALRKIAVDNSQVTIIFSLHLNPKLKYKIKNELAGIDRIKLLPPLDYQEFINLLAKSYLVITDSGGLQEEAPSFNIPVLVIRNITEREAGLAQGTIKLIGTETHRIQQEVNKLLNNQTEYQRIASSANPYGDGRASLRIVNKILSYFGIKNCSPKNFTDF